MKRFSILCLLAACCSLVACKGSKVSLRGDSFSFDTQTPPAVILPAAGGPASSFTDEPRDGFTIVIPLLLSSFTEDTELLCIPGTVNVRLRLHNPKDVETQNYPAGKMPDGSFDPKANATRAENAAVMERMIESILTSLSEAE